MHLAAAGQGVVVKVQAILDPGGQSLKFIEGQGFESIRWHIQQPQSVQAAPLLHQLQGEAWDLVVAQVEPLQAVETGEGRAIYLRDAVAVKQQHLKVLKRLKDELVQLADSIGGKVQMLKRFHIHKGLRGEEGEAIVAEKQAVESLEWDRGPLST